MRHLIFFFIITLLIQPHTVCAHPETGLLPDAIAETEYKIVLEINPRDIATKTKLGMVLYRKNKLKEAEQQVSEVLKSAPKDFDAHDVMGLIRLREKKFAESVEWFQKAIAINSEDTMVYHGLGQSLEQLGRLREAEVAYRKGLEVSERLSRKGLNREKEAERKKMILASLQNLQARGK